METLKTSVDYDLIKECYESDPFFLACFPKEIRHDLTECFKKSKKEFEETKDLDFYIVKSYNNVIGYFAIQKKMFLFTFFIKPEYRKLKHIFWKEVLKKAEFPFVCGMFERNPRAVKFFKDNGARLSYSGLKNNEMAHVFIFDNKGEF